MSFSYIFKCSLARKIKDLDLSKKVLYLEKLSLYSETVNTSWNCKWA